MRLLIWGLIFHFKISTISSLQLWLKNLQQQLNWLKDWLKTHIWMWLIYNVATIHVRNSTFYKQDHIFKGYHQHFLKLRNSNVDDITFSNVSCLLLSSFAFVWSQCIFAIKTQHFLKISWHSSLTCQDTFEMVQHIKTSHATTHVSAV